MFAVTTAQKINARSTHLISFNIKGDVAYRRRFLLPKHQKRATSRLLQDAHEIVHEPLVFL